MIGDHMTLNGGWQSTQTVPLPHRRLEIEDEEGIVLEGWYDGAVFYFQNGGTGNAVARWRYKRFDERN